MKELDLNALGDQVRRASTHLASLRKHGLAAGGSELLPEALEELQVTLDELRVAEDELRQQNEQLAGARFAVDEARWRYLNLLEFAPLGYIVTSPAGLIREMNLAAAQMLGVDPTLVHLRQLPMLVPEALRAAFREQTRRVLTGRARRVWQTAIGRRTSEAVDVEVTAAPLVDAGGAVTGLRWMIQDISERKAIREELRRREEHFRALIENISDVITIVDGDATIRYHSPSIRAVLGYEPAERVGTHVLDLVHPDDLPAMRRVMQRIGGAEGARLTQVARLRHKNGTWRTAEVTAQNLLGNSAIGGVLLVSRDITERRRLEAQVVAISSEERARVGRDLHDGVGQVLTALNLSIGLLERKLTQRGAEEAADAADLRGLVAQALTETRRIARGLHGSDDSGDLVAALEDLCLASGSLFRINCDVACAGDRPILDPDVVAHLHRITQEAIHNAVRHGKALDVEVGVTATESGVTVTIRDNGGGIRPHDAASGGMGLDLMRYRARQIGAQFDIGGGSNGTTVTCALAGQIELRPLASAANPADGPGRPGTR